MHRFLSSLIGHRLYFTWGLILLFCVGGRVQPAAAQIENVDALLRGGTADARTLIDAYLAPGVTGFETGLNTGWTGAAKPHSVLGFHLRIGATLSRVPSSDRTFTLLPGDLTTLTLENGEIGSSPTVAGEEDAPTYQLGLPSGSTISMPEGSGFSFAPTPVIEAGIGIVRDTEVMLRLVPSVGVVDNYGTVSLFGAGVKHGLNQWVPGRTPLPVDVTAMVHYTRFDLDADLEESGNQRLEWGTDTWAVTALVGKSIPVVSVYGGLGVETAATEIAMKGTYEIENDQGIPATVEDPLSISFDRNTSLRALGGVRIRLGFTALYLEGTLANYSSLTAGLGLSVR
jgi:hypothetical protein